MLVVFSKKQVENAITCYFLHVGTSHSHMNQIMQHSICCMANNVDPNQPLLHQLADLDPHCLQGSLNIGSES